MKVVMRTIYAGPLGTANVGQTLDADEDTARALIAGGFAVLPTTLAVAEAGANLLAAEEALLEAQSAEADVLAAAEAARDAAAQAAAQAAAAAADEDEADEADEG